MTALDRLEQRMAEFVPERLSVDWRKGPTYETPPEVDYVRVETMAQQGQRYRVNRSVLSQDALRDPKTRVMYAFAPEEDFSRPPPSSGSVRGWLFRFVGRDIFALARFFGGAGGIPTGG